jgi:hypothetical protein
VTEGVRHVVHHVHACNPAEVSAKLGAPRARLKSRNKVPYAIVEAEDFRPRYVTRSFKAAKIL